MNIPISRAELSVILGVGYADIDALWESGKLQRTVACEYRPSLKHSSPFDLPEYWLSSDSAKHGLSREQAALWVFCLSEAVETEGFPERSFYEKLRTLLLGADAESLTLDRPYATKVVVDLIKKYETVLCLASRNDAVRNAI